MTVTTAKDFEGPFYFCQLIGRRQAERKQGPSRAEEAAGRLSGKKYHAFISGGHCPVQDRSLIALIYKSTI